MKSCPVCGHQCPDDAAFCSFCGAKFEEGRFYCPHCGSPVKKSDGFCPSCGAHLTGSDTGSLPVGKKAKRMTQKRRKWSLVIIPGCIAAVLLVFFFVFRSGFFEQRSGYVHIVSRQVKDPSVQFFSVDQKASSKEKQTVWSVNRQITQSVSEYADKEETSSENINVFCSTHRSDDQIISLTAYLQTTSNDYGKTIFWNYDASTGTKLGISDVVKDTETFSDEVYQAMLDSDLNAVTDKSREETVRYIESRLKSGTLMWHVFKNGIGVSIDAKAVAEGYANFYAYSWFVGYEDHPDLFERKYFHNTQRNVVLPLCAELYYPGNSTSTGINCYGCDMGADTRIGYVTDIEADGFQVVKNGKSTLISEPYLHPDSAYAVKDQKNHMWLLLIVVNIPEDETDYHMETYVFNMDGEKPVLSSVQEGFPCPEEGKADSFRFSPGPTFQYMKNVYTCRLTDEGKIERTDTH